VQKLNLPEYQLRTKTEKGKLHIFDNIRKKWLVLTPEEWVRQNFIAYLVQDKKYPASLISIEVKVEYNGKPQRSDIVIYDKQAKPLMVIECKAPEVAITQDTFYQAARYNSQLIAKYIVVTNGLNHYCCEMDYEDGKHQFLEEVPERG
jgi:hypothetical protein